MFEDFFKSIKEHLTPSIPTAEELFLLALHGESGVILDKNERINKCVRKAVDWAHGKALSQEFQCLAKIDKDLLEYKDEIIDILKNKYHFIVVDCATFDDKYKHLLLLDVDSSLFPKN